KEITPFLLAKVVELTGGESLATNIQLALNNARCASKIAAELARL
ncbi:MAG: pseudouridine-5'-phosphate glycosidase, partial [Firmicutes bacterium]|nr:pseudouridine-5'-phosphate glycosidase [Bacillota bacterium]